MPNAPRRRCRNPACPNPRACRDRAHLDSRNHYGIPRQERGLGADFQRLAPEVISAAGGRCQLRLPGCTDVATTANHRIPRGRGGMTVRENLEASCFHCNAALGARDRRDVVRA